MADTTSYLEKMGRELKCPICLSLLDSSVSLTCNHVFCNLCIRKSMKSGANCPVCKVPYQRREIRPAPHMDNVVNIYKSMKAASRTSVSITQDDSTSKLDPKRHMDEDLDPANQKTDDEAPQMPKLRQKTNTTKRPKSKAKNSGHKQGISSFAMNKRVQMPESPSTETPLREAKEEFEKKQMCKKVMNDNVGQSGKHPISNGRDSSSLAPFFWLQDEDAEKSSQQTDEEQLTCTPADVPSFSDIKDSDDDVPTKQTPRSIRKCDNVEPFDSEMFELIQRPCSPKLCPSLMKMQVDKKDAYDGMCENGLEEASNDGAIPNVNPREMNEDNYKLERESCSGSSDNSQNKSKISKRGSKGTKRNQNKRRKINMDRCSDADYYPNSTNCVIELGQKSENISALDRSESEGKGKCNTIELENRNSKRNKKIHARKQKQKLTKCAELIASQDKTTGDSAPESNSFPETSVGEPSSGPVRPSHKSKRYSKKIKENIPGTNDLQEKMVDVSKDVSAATSKNDDLGVSPKILKARLQSDALTLQKCNASSVTCAFCLKKEESEASGEMVHYAEGKPVSATHVGTSVLHTHKNCAEWAPNVYFENDIAFNLEEELARSRRIKCSLCGEKGAALGCYEKRCSRSFHVPCAKKLRECRWDTDHFVILCPLHASSKLPCEKSMPRVSQVNSGKCNPKSEVRNQQTQQSVKSANDSWTCGRATEKIVLCGSALTIDEKEAVSEFSKSSGFALFPNWNSTVTHVIASTDENGACKRTLKVLKGILEGKWVLNIKWVEACMKASKLVEEAPYEISSDIYGIKNGPYLGILRLRNKQPKLFSGFEFYLTGDFQPAYATYLQDLATTAGGKILLRKPIAEDASSGTSTFIIYAEKPDQCNPSRKSLTVKRRRSEAEALAKTSGARVAHDTWLFNCIAGHKVLGL